MSQRPPEIELQTRPPSDRRRGLGRARLGSFALWLLASLLAFAFVLRGSIQSSERSFGEYTERIHTHLRDKLRANEAVLYGFASFLGAIGEGENARNSARTYASSVLRSYPHIYMLQIVRKLPHDQAEAYVAQLRSGPLPGFEIRQFSYKGTRTWQRPPRKEHYYPIVFMAPEPPRSRDVYGLDIDSLDNLKQALLRSEREGTPISSGPFRTVEGDIAYIMFRPVISSFARTTRVQDEISPEVSYALLVVRTGELLPALTQLSDDVHHRAESRAEGSSRHSEPLFDLPAAPAGWLERRLLPVLHSERLIDDASQPLHLAFSRQVRLQDIDAPALMVAALASLLSLATLIAFLRSQDRQRSAREASQRAIERLALYDALTGLPNRYLLLGHLEQACSLALRHDMKVGVLFLDLDGFKPVNDRLGHPVGDIVLQAVARRLQACIRECDTAARYGGDEFVILLTEIWAGDDASKVAEKILDAIARPIHVNGVSISIGTSIGIAIFPECGSGASDLIDAADQAMYAAKQNRSGGYAFATGYSPRAQPRPRHSPGRERSRAARA